MNSAPAPILLRPARVVEVETIRALERASAQRFLGLMDAIAADEPTPAPTLARRIVEGGLLVAQAEDGIVAGFVMFRPLEGGLYVEQLDVLPAFAGRRIGAALLDAAGERLGHGGVLVLSTFRDVPWNAPYYARLGFVAVDELTPGMAAIRAEHLARGLDEAARVFMARPL
ncbi:N-acetyltransferase [Caulobacter flavus]|jgi:predicted N-acetyltransferase YhbS|uniref:N-acetyltransferase n=1 Tax=Caulobacter flavus TaxID=1679497 RepID=A0A2N5CNH4_9CAUL|nr:GNAT family N-acetyltransferase [Caulobacter flavus]AYV49380.1 N-acetyltransferase [Caulobacter flavus]PLR08043.1 N-acetyltransferase [Caulobacter flavus]